MRESVSRTGRVSKSSNEKRSMYKWCRGKDGREVVGEKARVGQLKKIGSSRLDHVENR